MENQEQNFTRTDEQAMLAEILENSRKTKNYIKWQLIITVALVVIPFIAMLVILPMVINSVTGLGSTDTSGLIQGIQ